MNFIREFGIAFDKRVFGINFDRDSVDVGDNFRKVSKGDLGSETSRELREEIYTRDKRGKNCYRLVLLQPQEDST